MAGNILDALIALLPKGPAWARSLSSNLRLLLTGVAVEMQRVQDRLDAAKVEIDSPATATETIADWETMVGLPSECTPIAGTLEERRAEAQQRWNRCGQWTDHVGESFLIDRIVELGYDEEDVEIHRFHFRPFTVESECDDSLYSDEAGWFLVYEYIVISGDNDARVVCEIENRYGQAHLGHTFAFPLCDWADGTFTRSSSAVFTNPETLIETPLAPNEMGQTFYGV